MMQFARRFVAVYVAGLALSGSAVWAQESQPAHDESLWLRNVRQVTSVEQGLDRAGEAYFSPDGKRISFQAYPKGKDEYQIYIMNVDGTGLQMISTGIGATTCSIWHPSGRHPGKATSQPASRPNGGGEPPSTAPSGGHPGGRPEQAATSRPTHGGGGPGSPSYAWKYYPGMDIFEYTLATGTLRRLTSTVGYDAECAYSPDGKSIVFSSFRDGPQEIYICDADGRNVRRITHAGGTNGGPFFSPDGQRICYRSDRTGTGNLQIFTNNTAGTAERTITDNRTFHWCPFWHPSGEWLIYTHADFRGRPNFDLYLVRAKGGEQYRVTSNPEFDGLPVFSPDGKYLMWTSRRGGLESPQIFIAEFIGLTPDGRVTAKQAPEEN